MVHRLCAFLQTVHEIHQPDIELNLWCKWEEHSIIGCPKECPDYQAREQVYCDEGLRALCARVAKVALREAAKDKPDLPNQPEVAVEWATFGGIDEHTAAMLVAKVLGYDK